MMKYIVLIFAIAVSLAVMTTCTVKKVNFTQNCGGYLKRAADANTVELAKKQLDIAINYVEANNITTGFTSVLWRTPDEDVEFWYSNLKECQDELSKININSSILEKTNLLMKLRETITDQGERGLNLTIPDGLSRYPNNVLWAILNTISIIALLSALAISLYIIDQNI